MGLRGIENSMTTFEDVFVPAENVIAPVALDQRGPVAAVLGWGPLAWLGGISYGIYLWHWPIFLVLNGQRTGWHGLSLFAVRCAATLARRRMKGESNQS